jgi:hypothetical protein
MQQQVVVKPGGEAEFAITVEYVRRSPEDARTRVKVEVVDFFVSRDGALSFGPETQHARSAVQWIALDAQELVLEPGQTKKMTGKVSAPPSADGDYWAAILMTMGGQKHEQGVNVILRTAAAVFVRAARRNYTPRPTIRAVDVSPPQFDEQVVAMVHDTSEETDATTHGPALTVQADVTNTGLVGFAASCKAYVYLGGRRRLAAIPLHALRRQILPGHERRFVGIMPTPLPAGEYTVRFTLEADSNAASRAFREATFRIGADVAQRWKESFQRQNLPHLQIEPRRISQVLTPGRFTAVGISITNRSGATMEVRCRTAEGDLTDGWLDASPTEFTLAPGMRHSIVCRFRTPLDAKEGLYSAALAIEGESAGLVQESRREQYGIPVSIEVVRK